MEIYKKRKTHFVKSKEKNTLGYYFDEINFTIELTDEEKKNLEIIIQRYIEDNNNLKDKYLKFSENLIAEFKKHQ